MSHLFTKTSPLKSEDAITSVLLLRRSHGSDSCLRLSKIHSSADLAHQIHEMDVITRSPVDEIGHPNEQLGHQKGSLSGEKQVGLDFYGMRFFFQTGFWGRA